MKLSFRSLLHRKDKPSAHDTCPLRLKAIPGWLAISPWIVVAGALLLSLAMLMVDYRNGERATAMMTRIHLEQGASAIRALKAALRASMTFQWSEDTLQIVMDRLATGSEVYYMAVTDEDGNVLLASDPALLEKPLLTPEKMRELAPSATPQGHVVTHSDRKQIYQVYQLLSFQRQIEDRLIMHGHRNRCRVDRNYEHFAAGKNPESIAEEFFNGLHSDISGIFPAKAQKLVVFVGYDMSPLLAARADDARRTFIHWIILTVISVMGLLAIFLIKGYQRSRRMVQETSAFTFALLDALPVGLIAVDLNDRISVINPEGERITGSHREDLLGRRLNEALPGLWMALHDTGLLHHDGKTQEQEVRCLFPDGRRVPLALIATPVEAQEGEEKEALGCAYILRDLGEIRRLEAEIRRQDRLAALGHMAAGIAHEIRNPLGAIKGLARFFQEMAPAGGEEERMAGIMTQEVQRLDNVVGNLLELARPDHLNRTPVSPVQLLERSRSLMQADMDKAGITYTQEVPDFCPLIMLDGDRMTQVLLNLFLNAIQAMPEGGTLTARVILPVVQEDMPSVQDDVLILEIEDSGHGIPKDKLTQIFSPYYTTKARGTGLGLSLVYKILEAHDGEIEVSSTEGKGTRFTMRLPIIAENAPEA